MCEHKTIVSVCISLPFFSFQYSLVLSDSLMPTLNARIESNATWCLESERFRCLSFSVCLCGHEPSYFIRADEFKLFFVVVAVDFYSDFFLCVCVWSALLNIFSISFCFFFTPVFVFRSDRFVSFWFHFRISSHIKTAELRDQTTNNLFVLWANFKALHIVRRL